MYTEKFSVKAFVAGVISFIFLALITYFVVTAAKHDTARILEGHDSMTYARTYNGEIIRVYVVTDPDYGQQYLVTDRGGITPRIKE